MPFSRQIRSNNTSAGRGLPKRPVNCLPSVLPSGYPAGTPQEALDCACGLYLGDTTAWLNPPPRRINRRDH